MMYHKIFGSEHNFYRLELDYRQYKEVGKRKVIAWTAQTKNVFGDNIPLTQYSLTGTPFDLRGIAHRDGLIPTDAEYRSRDLVETYNQPSGFRSMGWMRIHGPHSH